MRSVILFVTLCAFDVNSYRNSEVCYGCRNNEYVRIKRGKYFSNPPTKFYDRPPFSPSIKGPFSFTPPPGYNPNDVGPPLPPRTRPYKVSKRPADEGLGDEDINNIIKYLSKKDLNKLIDLAMDSERYSGAHREPPPTQSEITVNEFTGQENTKYLNGPYVRAENKPYSVINTDYFTNSHQIPANNPSNDHTFIQTGDSMQEQFSFLDAYIQKEISEMRPEKSNVLYTDSRTMQEEQLPRPSNLRNNDFDTSYTNNVPKVIKLETSYDIKNFADLPLMNFENSKLDTVNSYKVPHYSVTSFKQTPSKISFPASPPSTSLQLPSSSFLLSSSPSSSFINAPEVEPAPPASVAKDQSDAHLKATKIWTHRSKGTAYTLHDDGTLTLEHPSKPSINNA